MVDVGVGKVPLGATKPPSRRVGGIGPTGPPFNRREELTVPFPALGCSVLLRSDQCVYLRFAVALLGSVLILVLLLVQMRRCYFTQMRWICL